MNNRLAPVTNTAPAEFEIEIVCVGNGWVKMNDEWNELAEFVLNDPNRWWDPTTWSSYADYRLSYDECYAADDAAWQEYEEAEELYGEFAVRMIEQGWKMDGWTDCPHHGIVRTDADGNCPYCVDEEETFELLPATMGTQYVYSDDEIPF